MVHVQLVAGSMNTFILFFYYFFYYRHVSFCFIFIFSVPCSLAASLPNDEVVFEPEVGSRRVGGKQQTSKGKIVLHQLCTTFVEPVGWAVLQKASDTPLSLLDVNRVLDKGCFVVDLTPNNLLLFLCLYYCHTT